MKFRLEELVVDPGSPDLLKSRAVVSDWYKVFLPLLVSSKVWVGGWVPTTGEYGEINITLVLRLRDVAERLGHDNDQIAFFVLHSGELIVLGGTGGSGLFSQEWYNTAGDR